jgi:polar amino acid transport system permease protein
MLRGGLQNIPKGQTEAAKAVGLSFSQTFIFVTLPQALRQVLPTWVNTAVETVKGSTLISLIGVVEITLVMQQIIGRNFLTMQFYALAGLIYFLICFSIERAGKYVEKKVAIK